MAAKEAVEAAAAAEEEKKKGSLLTRMAAGEEDEKSKAESLAKADAEKAKAAAKKGGKKKKDEDDVMDAFKDMVQEVVIPQVNIKHIVTGELADDDIDVLTLERSRAGLVPVIPVTCARASRCAFPVWRARAQRVRYSVARARRYGALDAVPVVCLKPRPPVQPPTPRPTTVTYTYMMLTWPIETFDGAPVMYAARFAYAFPVLAAIRQCAHPSICVT